MDLKKLKNVKVENNATTTNLKIEKIETAKSSLPQRKLMKDGTLPRFPNSMLISGRSGSGKTNLLINLLTRKEFYGNFYHYIIVYSPTANKYDDLYASLNLPEENFIEEFGQEQLQQLIDARKKLIGDKGIEWVGKNARCLILMDDVIANRSFLESQTALTMFALLRHYLCSVCILIQAFTKIPKGIRNNCNAICVFPANQSEIEVLLDEITPAGIRKRDFEKVIDYATAEPYTFLYINNHAEKGKRIRKNLDLIINLKDFMK